MKHGAGMRVCLRHGPVPSELKCAFAVRTFSDTQCTPISEPQYSLVHSQILTVDLVMSLRGLFSSSPGPSWGWRLHFVAISLLN